MLYQVAIKELKCPLSLALSPASGGEGIKDKIIHLKAKRYYTD